MHWKNEQYWLDNSSHAHILADVPESNGETLRMQYAVPPTVTQGLYRICRKNDALIFSFLYAVLTILLNEVSIEERIVTLMLKKEKGEIVGAPVCTPFSNGTIKNFIVQFNKYLQNALIHMISIKNLSCEDMIYQISFGSISDCEIPCRISDLHVSYKVFGEELIVTFTCKTNSFSSSFLSALIKSYGKLLYQTVVSPDTMLSAIELCSSEDKEQILHHFNKPINSQSSSFRELIERPFLKGAGRLAVTQAIHWKTAMQEYDDHAYARQFFLRSHFSANRFAHVFSHKSYIKAISEMEMIDGWKLMKTNAGNSILINRTGICFIKMVERYHTVYQVQKHLDEIHGLLDLYDLGNMENFKKDSVKRFNIDIKKDDGLIRTIKKLLDLNILVYGTNRIKPAYLTEEGLEYHISDSKETKEELGKTDILLLGDSTGTSSVGILYLASYLHRMGVRVKCQLNHSRFWPLEKHIQNLLARFRPKFVGISMKWFPHMERVETICRLIKSIRPDIKIVLGGNTASQFYTSLIQKDYVDYIIRGDGELPLSELCLGASYIHNAVYKKKGQIVVNPIEYIQDQGDKRCLFIKFRRYINHAGSSVVYG